MKSLSGTSTMRARDALRTIVKAPGPSVVIVLTLAIAIGATTIIASTIDGVWHAIPASDTERLVFIASTDPRPSQAQSGTTGNLAMTGTSIPDLVDWTTQTTTIEQFGAFRYGTATVPGRAAPARVSLVRVTAGMFSLWGISPAQGRVFHADDGRIGAPPVVLLSHRYWQEALSGEPSAIGASVVLDGTAHTVVGILPRDVRRGIFTDTDLFVVQPLDVARSARHDRRFFVTARLEPGVTRAEAEADLTAIANRLKVEYPDSNAQTGVVVRPLIEQLGGQIHVLLLLLALIAALVAAMACANVSNVVLAQAIGRQRESSIRAALGAGRLDHLTRITMESLVLSLIAGATGLVLGGWGLALLKWLAGPEARLFGDATLNWRVVAAGMAAAFLLPLGFALIPALQSWRPNPADLKEGARAIGASGHAVRRAVVAVQVGLAVVLLVQIALFARTAWSFRTIESGFEPRGLLTFRVELPAAKYNPEATAQFYRALLTRIESLPGVDAAAAVNRLPIAERELSARIKVDGAVTLDEDALPFTALTTVTSRYFETMRLAIVRGRSFTEADFTRNKTPVAVVSEDASRQFWPGRDPIGTRVTIVSRDMPGTPLEVVGIVANVRRADIDQRTMPQVYIPSTWTTERAMAVVVRTDATDPLQSIQAIRAQAAALDPNEPLFDVASMEQVLYSDQASIYTLAGLLGVIAMVALGLAGVGIYGVVSFMVIGRTPEIGLRMALGARPAAVLRMVLRQAAQPVAGGGLLGAPAAFALVYAMSGAFTVVNVRNPLDYIGVAVAIALVALIASAVPARRAALIDPLRALKR